MGDLSAHFSKSEFACHCRKCGFDTPNPHLVGLLEEIRESVKKPIRIVSGCRCEKHNKSVGGAKNSQHKLGNAADIQIDGMTADAVHHYLTSFFDAKIGGMGRYKTFVHIDVRSNRARWSG